MPRFGMVIDTKQCVGCMDCVVACQTENDVPEGFVQGLARDRGEGHVSEPDDGDPQ